jgi:hypothetical protein
MGPPLLKQGGRGLPVHYPSNMLGCGLIFGQKCLHSYYYNFLRPPPPFFLGQIFHTHLLNEKIASKRFYK